MIRRTSLFALSALIVACGAAPQGDTARVQDSGQTPPASAPAAETAREGAAPAGESCLSIARIREARPVSDDRIDFVTRGGEVYVNHLPNSCPGLGFERAFTYSTSLSRLCSTDIIQVVQQGGGPALGASCGLGRFVPAGREQ